MPENMLQAIEKIAIYIVPAMLGIILHEVAHGFCAYRFGDPTARHLGRLTLNPIPHIDPMGLVVFVLTSLSGAFVFGWAKPVPVNPSYFKNPRKGMMYVALAGPFTNFLLAILFSLLLWGTLYFFPPRYLVETPFAMTILTALKAGIIINLGLGWLNLLPIPPLDGSKILAFFLPSAVVTQYLRLERYGFLLLLLLIFTGILNAILVPLIQVSTKGVLFYLNH
ncbi:MAG: site-2 protease family protein [Desulfovibrio sp.]|nr:site-2 protease family protein [Desulfovibrio sp.]